MIRVKDGNLIFNSIKISFRHISFIKVCGKELNIWIKNKYIFFYNEGNINFIFSNNLIAKNILSQLNDRKVFNQIGTEIFFLKKDEINRVLSKKVLCIKTPFNQRECKMIAKYEYDTLKIDVGRFSDLCYHNYTLKKSNLYRIKSLELLLENKNIKKIIFHNILIRSHLGKDCRNYDMYDIKKYLKFLSNRVIDIELLFHTFDLESENYSKKVFLETNKYITIINGEKINNSIRSLKELCIGTIKNENINIRKLPKLLFRVFT